MPRDNPHRATAIQLRRRHPNRIPTAAPYTIRRGHRRGWRREDGAGTVELVIATPLLLLLLLLVVQVAVWAHATHLAQAAANAALQSARAYQGSADRGQADALALLDQAGTTLTAAGVTVNRGSDTVRVTVTGSAASVVPFLHPPIRIDMAAPVERPPGG